MVPRQQPVPSTKFTVLVTVAVLALIQLITVSSIALAADSPAPEKLQLLTNFFEDEVASGRLPGAAVLIQQHGRIVYLKAFGVRDVKTRQPMTADTQFALLSMTKPITSFAAMMLIDAGKLSLDDTVAKYIPSFANRPVGVENVDASGVPSVALVAAQRPPTIKDLLLHTSGIAGDYVKGWARSAYLEAHLFDGHFDNAGFVERIARLPLTQQPGTFWRYGHSTDVLGRIIEVVSGESLSHFMKRQLFDPLGMSHTKFVLDSLDEQKLMAEPLPDDTILLEWERARRLHPEWESGGSGLVSTLFDYARFAQMLLHGGELDGRRYLSSSAFKDMTTDHVGPGSGVGHDYFYFPGDGFGFGYGLAIRTGLGEMQLAGSIGELKWDSGSGTYFGVNPKLDMIYVLMEQVDKERGPIRDSLRKLLYGAFPTDR